VLAGAFVAHALRGHLAPDMLAAFETGVRYQLVHALTLVLVAIVLRLAPSRATRVAGWLFVAGSVLFSGSLYALSVSGVRALGAITPLGGLCFLGGWLTFAFGAARLR
jgi:uncharacterized membrane protein YgdD (TMEM256/DUF423 family)